MPPPRVRSGPMPTALVVHAVSLEWERIRGQLASAHQLSPVDVTAVLELRRRPDVRAGELASAINLSASGLSALLDRLVGAGLAARGTTDGDRRSVTVHLTPNGVAVADEALGHPALTRLTAALRGQPSPSTQG